MRLDLQEFYGMRKSLFMIYGSLEHAQRGAVRPSEHWAKGYPETVPGLGSRGYSAQKNGRSSHSEFQSLC